MDSRIVSVKWFTLRGKRPRVVGRNARLDTHGQYASDSIALLRTDDGLEGWGWSRANRQDAERILGKRLNELFDPIAGTREPYLMFDFPLWDLAGETLQKPVYDMLGGGGESPAPVYDGAIYIDEIDPETGADAGLQPMLDAVQAGWDAGHRAFKVKIGRGHRWMEKRAGMRRDIDTLRAVREQIGNGGTLMADANNGYSPSEARELIAQTADCSLFWIEEPFPEDAEETAALRRFIQEGGWNTYVADGEGSESRDEAFTETVRAGGVDVVQFDLRAYTLTRWLRYWPVLEETGTLYAPHNWGSHLSGFYIPQMARGLPRFAMGETDTMEMPAVGADGYPLQDGFRAVPDAPGFGLTLNPEAAERALQSEDSWSAEIS